MLRDSLTAIKRSEMLKQREFLLFLKGSKQVYIYIYYCSYSFCSCSCSSGALSNWNGIDYFSSSIPYLERVSEGNGKYFVWSAKEMENDNDKDELKLKQQSAKQTYVAGLFNQTKSTLSTKDFFKVCNHCNVTIDIDLHFSKYSIYSSQVFLLFSEGQVSIFEQDIRFFLSFVF